MERLGSGRNLSAMAVAVAAAVLLTGCSVTVQPKNAAATKPAVTIPDASPTTVASTPTPTPDKPSATGKDVDKVVCPAVRAAFANAAQKVQADKGEPKKIGADYRAVAATLRTQATKTKNADLKSTLDKLATAYDGLATDEAASKSTDGDQKKIDEAGKPLDTLCGQKG